MSGAMIPRCLRCGKVGYDTRLNPLIGGWYCPPCDDYITKPDPKLEQRYNRRVALRKAKEAAA
ncbi:MAG: hypothetical protein M3P26_16305 [Gemmatimonadota bacterium]|nr:hypothetical protein [Gemmatimonadota bacterium]